MSKIYFVYILANTRRGVLYVGLTNDLIQRLAQHRSKAIPGFTRTHGVHRLVYYEQFASIMEAKVREHTVKRWRRAWKFALIEGVNPDWRDLADELVFLG